MSAREFTENRDNTDERKKEQRIECIALHCIGIHWYTHTRIYETKLATPFCMATCMTRVKLNFKALLFLSLLLTISYESFGLNLHHD